MLNVLIVFSALQSCLTFGLFVTQGVSALGIFALFQILTMIILLLYFRRTQHKSALILIAALLIISSLFYGYQFSQTFNVASKTLQMLTALLMNSSLVLMTILVVFGIWVNDKEEMDTKQ